MSAKFHAGDILQAHNCPGGGFAHNNFSEFLGGCQPALGSDGIGILLAFRNGFAAHLTCRVYGVLRLDCRDNLRHGDGQLGQLVGLDPQPHGILARTENLDASDAVGASKLIGQVDVGVVGKEARIVSAIG